jgi:hypothetical protein
MNYDSKSFRGSLPQNLEKAADSHPDFSGRLGSWSGAVWFSETSKGRPYLSLHLTSEKDASQQKVKIAIWELTPRKDATTPHFRTRETINERRFIISAWILSDRENGLHRVEILVEPAITDSESLSGPAAETQTKLEAFLRESQLTLPSSEGAKQGASPAQTSLVTGISDPEEIPF